jgi:cystathionine beta-lyase
MRRGSKWSRYDPDVLPAWIADSDFLCCEPIQSAIDRIVLQRDYGYPRRRLMPAERMVAEAFAIRMASRYEWRIDPDHVQPVTDLLQATIAAVVALTEPGDGIALHTPCYPPFREAIHDAKRRLVELPMRDNGTRWVPDFEEFEQRASSAKLLIICNPHNPTGRVFTRYELERMTRIAASNDLVIFSDEIHAEIIYPGHRHIPTASIDPEVATHTITVNSASKAFNIAGLRCGVMHFGSAELLARFRGRVPRLLLGKPSVLAIDATVAAWEEGGIWLDAILAQLAANRELVRYTIATRMPSLRMRVPEASFLAWIDCSACGWNEPASDVFLHGARVALSDGESFCPRHAAFVRLNFATSPEILSEILARMERLLHSGRN